MTETDQEKFRLKLKNPFMAKLNEAIDEFKYAHPSIRSARIFHKPDSNFYNIEVYAENDEFLRATSEIFISTIKKHLGRHTWVNERDHPGEAAYAYNDSLHLYRHSYFVEDSR